MDEKDRCCFCFDDLENGVVYYTPPCGHVFCYKCMREEARLNVCTSCTAPFTIATAVKVYLVANCDDDTDDTEDETEEEEPEPTAIEKVRMLIGRLTQRWCEVHDDIEETLLDTDDIPEELAADLRRIHDTLVENINEVENSLT